MLQNCAKRLRSHRGELSKSIPCRLWWVKGTATCKLAVRHLAALPQTACEDVDSENSTSQPTATGAASVDMRTRKRYDALFWPEVNSADVQLDLTKTYVKRYVSEHFDTVIDPQFPTQTGLPMTVYISQKQDHRPASVEVSQYYGNHHNLEDIFTITIPRTVADTPRIIGDTGTIKLKDLAKAYKFIEVNRNMLLDVWEHGEDEANDVAWKYYKYIIRIV